MRALVIGAGGFIGHNLVKRLKSEGWFVTGVDLHFPYFDVSPADNFYTLDATTLDWHFQYDRIYQLAADMGGAGFVFTGDNDADILTKSLSINLNVLEQLKNFKGKIFFSSSVCVYPDGVEGRESDAYPADPPSNYGWEKLTSERLYLAYAKNYGLDVRIARFHNCYGPYSVFEGGREKSPAAICRKVIRAYDSIDIWGDGEQLRPFIYVDDLLDGIEVLMNSEIREPVNIGPDGGVTINQLVDIVSGIAKKQLKKHYVSGPTGGLIRNTNNDLIKSLGWFPKTNLEDGLEKTYTWINKICEK